MEKINQALQKLLIGLINLYKYLVSPILGQHCRFYPSCSSYSKLAIQRFGCFRGMILTIKRLLCCQPWHRGGYDPVPKSTHTFKEANK